MLEHACHHIVVGSLDPQVVIGPLVVVAHSGHHFLKAHCLMIWVPGGVTVDITDNIFHLEDMRRLFQAARGHLI